jgi:hypothetical protein
METSPQSWAETDLKRLFGSGETERNTDAGDLSGPVSIAVAVSAAGPAPEPPPTPETTPAAPRQETRLVVVGDSDFASNRARHTGNRDLPEHGQLAGPAGGLIMIRPGTCQAVSRSPPTSRRASTDRFLGIPVLLIGNAVRVRWKRR